MHTASNRLRYLLLASLTIYINYWAIMPYPTHQEFPAVSNPSSGSDDHRSIDAVPTLLEHPSHGTTDQQRAEQHPYVHTSPAPPRNVRIVPRSKSSSPNRRPNHVVLTDGRKIKNEILSEVREVFQEYNARFSRLEEFLLKPRTQFGGKERENEPIRVETGHHQPQAKCNCSSTSMTNIHARLDHVTTLLENLGNPGSNPDETEPKVLASSSDVQTCNQAPSVGMGSHGFAVDANRKNRQGRGGHGFVVNANGEYLEGRGGFVQESQDRDVNQFTTERSHNVDGTRSSGEHDSGDLKQAYSDVYQFGERSSCSDGTGRSYSDKHAYAHEDLKQAMEGILKQALQGIENRLSERVDILSEAVAKLGSWTSSFAQHANAQGEFVRGMAPQVEQISTRCHQILERQNENTQAGNKLNGDELLRQEERLEKLSGENRAILSGLDRLERRVKTWERNMEKFYEAILRRQEKNNTMDEELLKTTIKNELKPAEMLDAMKALTASGTSKSVISLTTHLDKIKRELFTVVEKEGTLVKNAIRRSAGDQSESRTQFVFDFYIDKFRERFELALAGDNNKVSAEDECDADGGDTGVRDASAKRHREVDGHNAILAGLDVECYSCGWSLEPVMNTSIRGYAQFTDKGILNVCILYGRNPYEVGLAPVPDRIMSCQAMVLNRSGEGGDMQVTLDLDHTKGGRPKGQNARQKHDVNNLQHKAGKSSESDEPNTFYWRESNINSNGISGRCIGRVLCTDVLEKGLDGFEDGAIRLRYHISIH